MATRRKIKKLSEPPVLLRRKRQRPRVADASNEIIIGLIGYAGSGCTLIAEKLQASLYENDYVVERIKLSALIAKHNPKLTLEAVEDGIDQGKQKLIRATHLQDLGDQLRNDHGNHAVASLAIQEIRRRRGGRSVGHERIAFVLDSLKHEDEVHLLRQVYDTSFRLVAVHCEKDNRFKRLYGPLKSNAKYKGASEADVLRYMDRDERDSQHDHGQQVRGAFYLADYFLDNNENTIEAARLIDDLDRFARLVLGHGLIRPKKEEVGMYHAFSASLQSSCLSRQVGAALQSEAGEIIALGKNEVPRFGGGTYDEGGPADNRCFVWQWKGKNESEEGIEYTGCHNTRRKRALADRVCDWLSEKLSESLAEIAHPVTEGRMDTARAARDLTAEEFKRFFGERRDLMRSLPGIGDIVEYSRSIHAEMDAILSAARTGAPIVNTILYCTTFPCHNCARHLVSTGVKEVYFIEPYVKSLAIELHYDSIQTELPPLGGDGKRISAAKLVIVPFTGVGPRMFDDYFLKKGELKEEDGTFLPPKGRSPVYSVRLRELEAVEQRAAELVN